MSEQHEGATERVELLPVYAPEQVEGALTFQALALLSFANTPTIPSPSTGAQLPVPYGSLLNYAQHLINEAANSNIRFLLQFHHYFGSADALEPSMPGEVLTIEQLDEMRSQGTVLDLNDPDVQKAIREGRIIIT